MIDAVYDRIGRLEIDADLEWRTPAGETLRLMTDAKGRLRIDGSTVSALAEATKALNALNVGINYRNLRRWRNPLRQEVHILVNGSPLLYWKPEKFPKVLRLGQLISFLRHLRS
ncbi:hypothetical protein [Lewinella sp. JB7]|uniref:hypothetical protein n=1 Tax=Lewinella sp. JB7 TaxID=2962887 RepID=UPI0020CA0B9C|nr:hypothetical protein [Lewinella sp. JB7]MCP9235294.1 hypothetical protein [Lewinella sp. JB7]